ncbi:MAG: hypothetical protein C7B45_07515 [Sulfobacillus acidophilus]|uniref:Uncharacterized protein n=1 Tax=Sulfobacillus acidophilus TaxID=53633 RepID=A0A2T2WIZ6_9FIRM|nr:MAG: hypothetical protein C7B45_07515 [Sulfobacillus acidophilus]
MIRERLESRIEKRVEAIIEPRIEEWLHRFFRTEEGEALIAEVTADFLLSWLRPDNAKGSYFQKTLLEVIRQLAQSDPQFREDVVVALNPHWKAET